MNSNVLAKFEYNGKTYVYYVMPDKPKNILYGYLENDVIKEVTDPKDASIMQEAYKKIFISSDPLNYIKLNTIRYNGKLFQKMYDKISKLTFFYEIIDNKFYMPNDEDLIALSSLYNKDELNFSNENVNKKRSLKKIIKIAGLSVLAIASTIAILTVNIDPAIASDGQNYEQTVKNKTEFSLPKLTEALQNNPNLTDAEKTFLKDILVVLEENSQHVEMGDELQRLETLITRYVKEGGGGGYAPWDNSITVNGTASFKDMDPVDIEVLVHEFFHCLSHPEYGIATGLFEALTGKLASEFLGTSFGNYYETYQLNILCEIIGPKPILAAYFSGDINYIINPLKQLIPDEDLAYQLLNGINDFYKYSMEYNVWGSELSEAELLANIDASRTIADRIIAQYFFAAKGYDIQSDVICSAMLNNLNQTTSDSKNELLVSVDGGATSISISYFSNTKGFFINKYIKDNPDYVLYFSGLVDHLVGYDSENNPIYFKYPDLMELRIGPKTNRDLSVNGNILIVNPSDVIGLGLSFGDGIKSGVQELALQEEQYFDENKDPIFYPEQTLYVKMLCEIIGSEPFESYLKTKDINDILTPLYNVIPEKEKALRLIGCIDATSAYYQQAANYFGSGPSNIIADDINQNLYDVRSEIYATLSSYFSEAKGYNLSSDIIMNSYYSKLIGDFTVDYCKHIWPVSFVFGNGSTADADDYCTKVLFKAYFNEEIKEYYKNPYLEVEFLPENSDDGEMESKIIYITDDNRQMESIVHPGAEDTNHYEFKGTDNLGKIQGKL